MKAMKRKTVQMLALCMALIGIYPAYADEMTVPEAIASDAIFHEADEILEIIEETPHVEAKYDLVTTYGAEHKASDKTESIQEIILKAATPSNAKHKGEKSVRETMVDGIKITLTADPGVFPEDAELWAEKVEDHAKEEAIDEAVEKERDRSANVALSYKFDIKMLLEGEEIQPDTNKGSVKVSFTLAESVDNGMDISLYHVTGEGEELTAEVLETEEEVTDVRIEGGSTESNIIISEISGFSFYVIEFSYGELKYTLSGSSVRLTKMLEALQISGRPTEAVSEDPELFKAEPHPTFESDWIITPLKVSDTPGTLKVKANGIDYSVSITVSAAKRENVQYVDADGSIKTADCIILQSCDGYTFESGEWYAVTENIQINGRIENTAKIDESSHLILTDGVKLTLKGGIHNGASSEITFYGQKNDSGMLFINSVPGYGAAIGGDREESNGKIYIHGGSFDVIAATFAAGIGAGMDGDIGYIEITGGNINATGGGAGAGIGAGLMCFGGGSVVIKGGTITATGGGHNVAAGIGSGAGSTTHGDLYIDDNAMYIKVGDTFITSAAYRHSRDNSVYIYPGPQYTVRHFYQNTDGKTYGEPEIEMMRGHEGKLSKAVPVVPRGFFYRPFEQKEVKADGSTVVDIYYDRQMCVLLFDANGHGTAPQTIKALYGVAVNEPPAPEALGYVFGGWYENPECTVPFTFSTMPDGIKILFAKWTKSVKMYTVTWLLTQTGRPIDQTEVGEGDLPQHDNPTFEDYVFIGWEPELVPATGNATYYANWERRGDDQMVVSFNTNGGTFVNTQIIKRDSVLSRPADPQKEGYIFDGWYRENTFITPYDFADLVNADMILHAKWAKIPRSAYTVTWKLDVDTVIDSTVVLAGDMPVHSDAEKEGHIFIGWNPSLAPVTKDVTYTAKFEERHPDSKVVRFSLGEGMFGDAQVVSIGEKAERPKDPVKLGYQFEDWYIDTAYSALYDFDTPVASDIMIYAKWRKTEGKEYTITWKDWNGEILSLSKTAEKELPKYPGAGKPSRYGYAFTGWTPEIELASADKTYTATYVKTSSGGGGNTVVLGKQTGPTFSPNWYSDEYGVWRIRNSAGQTVANAWLCDDAVKANGQNVWYLLTADGAMIANGLVQDNTGNFYSLETEHNGYFGMLRYQDGTYNCNGQEVYLTFNREHNGSFGAITNAEGLEKLKAIYGITQYGIGNENAVYTAAF